jgi:ABC-type transport system involved in multi-copper enzyme maturation permease subunit
MTTITLHRSPGSGSLLPDPTARPSTVRLVALEMRKMVDTRSGFWLVLAMVLGSLATVGVQLIWGAEEAGNLRQYFSNAMVPMLVLLPVLGIMTVTTEWSQRTALTTFAQVPQRHRVVLAKLAAVVVWSLAALVVCLVVATAATALTDVLDLGVGTWNLTFTAFWHAVLPQVLSGLMGVGFGMLLLNTPAAIVLYFVLPTVLQIVNSSIEGVHRVTEWVTVNEAMAPLLDGGMTGRGWAQLATSATAWIAVPLALGAVRVLRSEVK